MSEAELARLAILSVGLGLLGFVEPCSMGANLLFIKYLEGGAAWAKIVQTGIYMLTRGLVIGAAEPGIGRVEGDVENRTVRVAYRGQATSPERIEAAMARLGYRVAGREGA
jgi:hypothetical protein